ISQTSVSAAISFDGQFSLRRINNAQIIANVVVINHSHKLLCTQSVRSAATFKVILIYPTKAVSDDISLTESLTGSLSEFELALMVVKVVKSFCSPFSVSLPIESVLVPLT